MSSLVKLTRKLINRNRRSRKAISTIMANLTMLIIVVSLSSLLFVWATSSFGAYTGGAGYWFSSRSIANQERLSVESVFFSGTSHNTVTLYLRNVGTIPVTVSSVYINSTLYQPSTQVLVGQVQPVGPITLTGQTWAKGDVQTVTVATLRGTLITTTWVS